MVATSATTDSSIQKTVRVMNTLELLLKALLRALPRIAEEGNYAVSVSRKQLFESLETQTQLAPEVVQPTLQLVELYFQKMGWLDPFELDAGNWKFSSFPASLAARSWLAVMADSQGVWYPSGWWQDKSNIEEQRKLLRDMEELRLENTSCPEPPEVRMVYVAWALIKLEGRLLFCEREDQQRQGVPHHVLAGGRLNLDDLRQMSPELSLVESLEQRQAPNSELAHLALRKTLLRELKEEVGLLQNEYEIGDSQRLKPFFKLEGAGANHAYTRYEIDLFEVKLNFNGFKRICRSEVLSRSNESPFPGKLSWFTPREVVESQHGGQRAFIDAWLKHYEFKQEILQKNLEELQVSYQDEVHVNEPVDLSADIHEPITSGKTGSETKVDARLDEEQLKLLLALGWHHKFGWQHPLKSTEGICCHRLGWIEVNTPELREALVQLQRTLEGAGFRILESHNRDWFRVSLKPEHLFFREEFFQYKLVKPVPDRWELWLFVQEWPTPLGVIPEIRFDVPLVSPTLFKYLKSVEKVEEDPDLYDDPLRFMRTSLDPHTRSYGLRKFVRSVGGELQILCDPVVD